MSGLHPLQVHNSSSSFLFHLAIRTTHKLGAQNRLEVLEGLFVIYLSFSFEDHIGTYLNVLD